MEIITPSFLKEINNGSVATGTSISGVILVSNYNVALTKNNKEYFTGTLLSGIKVPFKSWGSSQAFTKLKAEEYQNTPTYIRGTVDNYNGTGSITVEDVTAVSDFSVDQFLEQRYNIDAYYDAMIKLVQANVSEKAMSIVNNIFTDELRDTFKTEFAASSHHDNCKGGLLAHTYKCLSLLNWTLSSYKTLMLMPNETEVSQDRKDLLFLGTMLHDVGKIREMNLGVYQNCSKVTHRYLGIEFISPLKEFIVSSYSEEWYYDLVSILLQHHGEWGDPCKTIVSYIVSKVDLFESQMTYIQQLMTEKLVTTSAGSRISVDGTWLSID